jgi:hypothetical protein
VAAGDGQDFVFVRTVGPGIATLLPMQLDLAVPVALDLGEKDDVGRGTNGAAPSTMVGGEGDDQFTSARSGETLVDAGPGDDQFGWSPPPSAPGMEAPVSSNIVVEGCAGDDQVQVGSLAGRLVADGGDGADNVRARGTTGSTRLAGGTGADLLASEANTGTDELGGDGDHAFWVRRSDIEAPVVRGGFTIATGGAGRDTFKVGRDGIAT